MKLFISLCFLWLLPFLITSFYNHPTIDDFWNAATVMSYGRAGAVSYFYHTVSARYTATVIMSFLTTLPEGNVWIFKVFPVVVILLLISSFFFLYRSLFATTARREAAAFSFVFVVLHISNMRSLYEGLYWMSSAVCYQVAVCLFAVNIGALVRDRHRPSLAMKLIVVTSCLLLPGTVEMIIPVYVLALLTLFYISIVYSHQKNMIIVCGIITLAVAFVLLLSSGDKIRVEKNSLLYHPSVWEAMFYSVRSAGYYAALWFTTSLNLIAIALFFFLTKRNTLQAMPAVKRKSFLFVCLLFVLCSLCIYAPLHLFESSIPFPRVTTLYFFLFFFFCFYIGSYLFQRSEKAKAITNYLKEGRIKVLLLVAFVVCAFTDRNFVAITKDLADGTTIRYDKETYERYAIIRHCRKDTCFIPPHHNWPLFAQSSAKEGMDTITLQHMPEYFKKTILFR